MPGLLCDILRHAVAGRPDMTIVGEAAELDELQEIRSDSPPDVLIIGLEDTELPPDCLRLLERWPRVKILAVGAEGREAVLHEFRPHAVPVRQVNVEGILREIVASVNRGVAAGYGAARTDHPARM